MEWLCAWFSFWEVKKGQFSQTCSNFFFFPFHFRNSPWKWWARHSPRCWTAGTRVVFHTWRSPRGPRRSSRCRSPSWTSCTWCSRAASSGLAAWCGPPPKSGITNLCRQHKRHHDGQKGICSSGALVLQGWSGVTVAQEWICQTINYTERSSHSVLVLIIPMRWTPTSSALTLIWFH